jgi:DNA-binding transcriptional MerR regulator
LERLTIAQAAKRLDITQEAIRQRVRRGTIKHEKGDDGKMYVYVEDLRDSRQGVADDVTDALTTVLQDRIDSLEHQLEQEREANRENRRLLALQLEHMRALEPPRGDHSEATGGPEASPERAGRGEDRPAEEQPQRRSWWREFFGVQEKR